MAIIDLGKIKLTNRGDWDNAIAYEVDDFVLHGNHTFICIQANTNEGPYDIATGTLNSQYWNFLAKGSAQSDWNADTGDSLILNRPVTLEPHLRVKAFPRHESGLHSYRCGMVLMEDDTVRCWGYSENGAHGTGYNYNLTKYLPVTVGLNGKASKIFQSRGCGYAIMKDGGVKAWGYNGYGSFGLNNTTLRPSPVDVPLPPGRTCIDIATPSAIGYSNAHVLYLLDDNTVRAAGYNGYGQLGDNSTVQRKYLVDPGLSGITEIYTSGGQYGASYAIKNDGTAWAWGYNPTGQLGVGDIVNKSAPVQVILPAGSHCVKIQPVGIATNGNCFFLLDDGRLFATGYNGQGTLGTGDASNKSTPIDVTPAGRTVTDVRCTTGTGGSTIILLDDKSIRTVGENVNGTLGVGSVTDHSTWQNPGMTDVLQIHAANIQNADGHFAVLVDVGNGDGSGKVYACGYNGNGNLGIGHKTNLAASNGMNDPRLFQAVFAPGNIVEMTSIGQTTECCLMLRDSSGNVLTTGFNTGGQRGNDPTPANIDSVFSRVPV